MSVFSGILTFAASPIAITGASGVISEEMGSETWPSGARAWRLFAQPMRANTHQCWIGHSDVTNNGTGPSISELLAPQAAAPLDNFQLNTAGSDRNFDPSIFFVHGTSGEKIRVTLWSA